MPEYPTHFFPQAFCTSGDKTIIANSAPTKGRANLPDGFPIDTATPIKNGGIAPNRLDFNGILYMLSSLAYWQQSGGQMQYDTTLTYTPPAIVYSNNTFWACLLENGPDAGVSVVPGSNAKYWIPLAQYLFQTYTTRLTGDVTGSGTLSTAGMTIKTTANQAAKWTTERTLTVAGDMEGSVSLDGSQDVTLNLKKTDSLVIVPVGGICIFSGTFGGTGNRYPIPLGKTTPVTDWVLCDGTTTNGLAVPDLRGRFIIGTNSTYAKGATGGSATHNHSFSGSVGATTISIAQMPSHNHPGRTIFTVQCGQETAEPYEGNWNGSCIGYTGGSQSHTHSLSASNTAASSLPPYYSLSYIMRIK